MSTYNAATELIDRNIEAGRGDKLAFIDTGAESPMANCSARPPRSPTCCAGSACGARSASP